MIRKCSCIVCVVWLMMALGITGRAEEQVGILRVIPTWCGQTVAEGTVSVSRVGMRTEKEILLTDGLANWIVEEEALQSGDWISWLSQHTEGVKQLAEVVPEQGALFENLEEGIYLVEQQRSSEYHSPFRPFLQTIPENSRWDITCCPSLIYNGEPPKTADRPAPIIGAMGIGLTAAVLMVLADRRKK